MLTLEEARINKNISLGVAAERVGVSVSTMLFYEKNQGEIKLSDAVLLSHLYGIKINSINFK